MSGNMTLTCPNSPVFLVGAERSGTTLLRLMLDHHPQLAWQSEFEFAVDMLHPDRDWPDLHAYYEFLEMSRIFRANDFTIDESLDYPSLVASFLEQKRTRDGKRLVGATVHRHFDRLERIWPEARYIYLLRDGRDVARSTIGMGWAGTVWFGVDRWIEAENIWAVMCARIPEERRIEVRYEDLVHETAATLTKACDFIGLPYDDAMLRYPDDSTYDLPDPSLTGQWKRKLPERDIRILEARIGAMLEMRGYELSGLPPLDITERKIKEFRRTDWERRLQFRLDRYGWSLLFAEIATRKAHLRPLWKPIKHRMSAIDVTYLK